MTAIRVAPGVSRSVERKSARLLTWPVMLAIVGALGAAMGVAALDGAPVGVFHDDAIYVILGRALATGQGYRYLNLPGTPAAIHYPPGYPALLAMLWTIAPAFPANLLLFKAANVALLAVGAVLTARLARTLLENDAAAASVGLLSAASVPILTLGSMVLSEPLFLALLIALLMVAERLVCSGSARMALGLGAGIGVLALVRTHGAVLAPAAVLVLLVRRRWRDAGLVAGGAAVVLLPWQLWSAAHGSDVPPALQGVYGSYAGWLAAGVRSEGPSFVLDTARHTVGDLAQLFAALFSPVRAPLAHAVTLVALGTLSSFGVRALARRAPVTLLFAAAYLAVTIAWPFPPARFVWAIWPVVLLLLAAGAAHAWRCRASTTTAARVACGVALACATWLAIGYSLYEVRAIRGAWWGSVARAERRRIEPAIEWTLARTSPSDVIASEDDGALFLYTGRRTVPVLSASPLRYLHPIPTEADARDGLGPILHQYHPAVVLVGSDVPLAVATLFTVPPMPRLQLREQFRGGAAFTVIAP